MKGFGKIVLTVLMLTGGSAATAVATSTPAAARVVIGIGFGGPGYWGPRYYGRWPCQNPEFREWHPYRCHVAVRYYGPAWAGYYDYGYWGPGYYQPVIGGFWFTDSWGYRRWHRGDFDGYGFHRDRWHRGWRYWGGQGRHWGDRDHGRHWDGHGRYRGDHYLHHVRDGHRDYFRGGHDRIGQSGPVHRGNRYGGPAHRSGGYSGRHGGGYGGGGSHHHNRH